MENSPSKILWIKLTEDRFLILRDYLEDKYIWTHVFVKENEEETYIGFYGNSQYKKMKKIMNEYIEYDNNYVAFCCKGKFSRGKEFIKYIYDMNSKEYLEYDKYSEFKEKYIKTLAKHQ